MTHTNPVQVWTGFQVADTAGWQVEGQDPLQAMLVVAASQDMEPGRLDLETDYKVAHLVEDTIYLVQQQGELGMPAGMDYKPCMGQSCYQHTASAAQLEPLAAQLESEQRDRTLQSWRSTK